MTDLHLCSALAATEFSPPQDVIFRVNNHFRDCVIFDADIRTPAQFWRTVYTWYCATQYQLNPSSSITLVVRWEGGEDAELSFPSRQPFEEPYPSKAFFRLLSGTSPDSVRTQIPVDWEFLSPALESDTDTPPVEEPTYEELL